MAHRIAFLEIADWEQPYLAKKLPGLAATYLPDELDQLKSFSTIAGSTILSVFVNSQVTPQLLAKLPKLKLIATRSTGFDHIDLAACAKRKIAVANVPSYGENTVAEQAFALLLDVTRKISTGRQRAAAGNWGDFDGLKGVDLKAKTMGIIGLGRIGAHSARIARGFGMEVLAYDVNKQPKLAAEIGFRYVDMPELLKKSDVISVHTFLSPETHHLLDRKALRATKKGVIIINTARGPIVDTVALAESVLSGHVAGAGLDVLEGEEYLKNPQLLMSRKVPAAELRSLVYSRQLLAMANVVVTPHNAFNTTEAIQRILDTTVANIKAFVAGKPANLVSAK